MVLNYIDLLLMPNLFNAFKVINSSDKFIAYSVINYRLPTGDVTSEGE